MISILKSRWSWGWILGLVLATSPGLAQEAEEVDPESSIFDTVVVMGAVISASISADEVVFTDLGDGSRTVVQREDGILVILARTEFATTLPALTNVGIKGISEAQRIILARRLELALGQLIRELAVPGTDLTVEDVAEVVKFLLSVDLPFDEGFIRSSAERFVGTGTGDVFRGTGGDGAAIFQAAEDPVEPGPTVPPPPPPPPVVTTPITPPPYFAP